MTPSDKPRFSTLLADAMAFYRKDVSPFALGVWWEACKSFDFEQVAKAITAHAMDPEQGRFPPMPADIVKQLAGTRTDRSLLAWGKVHEAMGRVGGYASVAFDDAVIHAVIEDMGGWPRLCRAEVDALPFEQKRFCETYRAYATRSDVPHLAVLPGVHADNNARFGRRHEPVLIGDYAKAKAIASGPSVSRSGPVGIGITLALPHTLAAAQLPNQGQA